MSLPRSRRPRPTSFQLSEYEGTYSHPAFGDFVITLQEEADKLTYKFGILLSGELNPSENPDEFYMTLDHPLTYRMAFYPQYPQGFPVSFSSSGGGTVDTVTVPYFEMSFPPVFLKS